MSHKIAFGQNLLIDNVQFEVKNNKIHLFYNLNGDENQFFNIQIKLLRKSDPKFILLPKLVEGDIGNNIKAGNKKTIIWNIQKELKGKLKGNDYYFRVEAYYKEKSISWYWFSGIIATGAATAAYFLMSSKSTPSNSKRIADPPGRP